jgi:hypothetical protein
MKWLAFSRLVAIRRRELRFAEHAFDDMAFLVRVPVAALFALCGWTWAVSLLLTLPNQSESKALASYPLSASSAPY